MTEKLNAGGLSATQKKYTPAFKAECVRQVAAEARQSDVARAQGISPALLGRWQRQAMEAAVPSCAPRSNAWKWSAPLHRGRPRHKMPLRAMPGVTAPAGCELNCGPNGTRWGVMTYALGYTEKACAP